MISHKPLRAAFKAGIILFIASSAALLTISAAQAYPLSSREDPGPGGSALRAGYSFDVQPECTGSGAPGLSGLKEGSAGSLWEGRALFLLGLSALEKKDSTALEYLEGPLLPAGIDDYIFFFRARALAQKGDLGASVALYDEVIENYPGSALKPEAVYRRALALLEAGDAAGARAGFLEFTAEFPRHNLVPDAHLRAAYASLRLDEPLEAVKSLKKVMTRFPAHAAAKDASALLERVRQKTEVPDLSDEERYQMAEGLFEAARFNDASSVFAILAKDRKGEFYDTSVIRLATAQVRLRLYDEADKTLKRYLSAAGAERELDALYRLAVVAVRRDDEDTLMEVEKRLSSKYHQTMTHARVLMFLGRFYESKGLQEKALSSYRHVLKDFKGNPSAEDALWSVGWMAYRGGKYLEAYRSFSLYPEIYPEGGNYAQFIYWSARSAEKLGNSRLAREINGGLCSSFGASYYCRMAEERWGPLQAPAPAGARLNELTGPACGEPAFDAFPAAVPAGALAEACREGTEPYYISEAEDSDLLPGDSLFEDPHYEAAVELLTLGLNQMAAEEVEMLTRLYNDDPEALAELADLFNRAGDYHRALRIYQRYLSWARGLERTMPGLKSLAFPLEVVDLVRGLSPEASDPFLIAAVMREESEFNPGAVSTTGAIGLMQIMPSTGRQIARDLGMDGFEARELLDPDVNIRFGSAYLDALLKRFGNNIVLAVAGYNAGPIAVERWVESLPAETDEFIESIPYPETRNYAKKVLRSYAEFLLQAGEKKGGRITSPLVSPSDPTAAKAVKRRKRS